jgi:hypothetical protein
VGDEVCRYDVISRLDTVEWTDGCEPELAPANGRAFGEPEGFRAWVRSAGPGEELVGFDVSGDVAIAAGRRVWLADVSGDGEVGPWSRVDGPPGRPHAAALAPEGTAAVVATDQGWWTATISPAGGLDGWRAAPGPRFEPPTSRVEVAAGRLFLSGADDVLQWAPLTAEGELGPWSIGFFPSATDGLAVARDALWVVGDGYLWTAPIDALPNPLGAWEYAGRAPGSGLVALPDGLAGLRTDNAAVTLMAGPFPVAEETAWRPAVRTTERLGWQGGDRFVGRDGRVFVASPLGDELFATERAP